MAETTARAMEQEVSASQPATSTNENAPSQSGGSEPVDMEELVRRQMLEAGIDPETGLPFDEKLTVPGQLRSWMW